MYEENGIAVSVVIPCLNEEAAVAEVVRDGWAGIEASGRPGEVLVIDNCSTDRSVEMAEGAGARVVHEPRRGYGSAYLRGLAEDQGISLELMHRVTTLAAGGFDALPHNGAVITVLAICGLNHRQSYKDIFVVAVAIPVAALIVVITLGSMFGGF